MNSKGDKHVSEEHLPIDSSDGAPPLPPTPPPAPQVVYIQGPTNAMAVASFILGLISLPLVFPLGWILGPLAVIFGVIGRRNAKGGAPHKGLATWGLGLGIVTSIVGIAFFAIAAACDCL